MSKNLSLYKNLVKEYWKKRADTVYSAMKKEWAKSTLPKSIARSKKSHPKWYK